MRWLALSIPIVWWLTACAPSEAPEALGPRVAPLAVQQSQAYEETVTGRFVSLIDFEPLESGGTRQPALQARLFTLTPADGGSRHYVQSPTRTGSGALAVTLAPGAVLTARPAFPDARPYTLLSLAVRTDQTRDDLSITLVAAGQRWTAPPQLAAAGWSTVLVDLGAAERAGLDLRRLEAVELSWAAAEAPVAFGLDDLMLLDNTRRLPDTPPAIAVLRRGLDYVITLPGWDEPIPFSPDGRGLWRCGALQPHLQLTAPGEALAGDVEDLAPLGPRCVGTAEVLEASAVRVRLRTTWYFPPRAGAWVDGDMRQVRWDHTFYPDGRWVVHVLLSNAGGERLGAVRLSAPREAAWSDGHLGTRSNVAAFDGPVGTWSLLLAPDTPDGQAQLAAFADPPPATLRLGRAVRAAGDANGDGFDESQGCYRAGAVGGNCRLELGLSDGPPLVRPIVCVQAPWRGDVWAQCRGLPLRPVARREDQAVAIVGEALDAPALIEFTGPVGYTDE